MKCAHFMLICHLLMLTYFLCGKYSMISILLWIIYWCWLFFMCKMFLLFSTDVYVIFCYWNISMKCMHFMLICHLLMLTYFLCGKYSMISILCKMFLLFLTDVYVIFCYWNILMKWMEFHLHLSVTDVDIFFVWKIFYNFNTAFDYLLMLTIFHVQNVVIILDWCLCYFLLLKYIDELDGLPSSFVTYWCWHFLCGKYSIISILLLIIYWCWLFFMCKMLLSFSTDVYVIFCYWNISMKCAHFMLICHLLMLTYFLCGKYSMISILLWIIYWCWLFHTALDYLLMLTIFHVQNVVIILDLMFMWFSVTEIYRWSACTSCWFVIYLCWHIFCVENILWFQYCAKCSYYSWLMFMWFSVTEIYWWSGWSSIFICQLLMLTYFLCGKYSTISILLLIIYWCWLFFMCKMLLSFSTDVYVIFCYWNISMNWMDFHLHLSLTDVDIFCVENILWFQYCFGLFTDVDYFSCAKCCYHSRLMFMLFCYWNILMNWIPSSLMLTFLCGKYSIISYCFWLFTDVDYFLCKMLLSFSTDVYVIFCYWNIWWTGWTSIFICHLLMLTSFVWKIFYDFNTALDYLLMLTIFHVQNVVIILDWCLCYFLLLKYIDELDGLPSSFVTYWCWHFLCGKYSIISILLLIIYWCWLFFMCKMLLSFSTDVYVIFCYWNISMKCAHFMLICHLLMLTYFLCGKYSMISILLWIIYWCWLFHTALDYLLMLTIFHVQNVVIILDWCLCDFLLLKYIDEVHALHVDLSFTYVDIFFVWKIFYDFNTVQNVLIILDWCLCDFLLLKYIDEVDGVPSSFVSYWCWHIFCVENILQFQYCFWLFTDVDYFSCAKCCYHSRLMFMLFSVTEIYRWTGWTSIFICHLLMLTFFVWKIFYDFNTALDYLLMLTIFHVQNVLIILEWCLCDFLLLKYIDEVDGLSSSFVTYWCWHIFCVENILQFEYCFWLFTDVDHFSCAKVSLRKFP